MEGQAEKSEQTFASELRRLRHAQGLTQAQVAAGVNRSLRSIQNLEVGKYAPNARTWNKLRELLGDELPVP